MRHQNYKYKIGATTSHRKSLLRNLSIELIDHKKIKTTLTKTRALRIFFEKLVTLAKVDSVANRRLAYSKLGNKEAVKKLFEDVAVKCKSRPGGYTRIVKVPDLRVGDGAKTAYISLVD